MAVKWSKFLKMGNDRKFQTWLKWAGLQKQPHQIRANAWGEQRENASECPGGIIADEMGLGKTIMLAGRIFCHKARRTLIVVPTTLLKQWDDVFQRCVVDLTAKARGWCLKKQYLVYHGPKTPSAKELESKRIVLTTYGIVKSRLKTLEQLPWDRVVYDEAHHLREMKTTLFKSAKRLGNAVRVSWFLTGTPIQNRVSDLYALCDLLGYEKELYTDDDGLRSILDEVMLRRTKKSIGMRLPPLESKTCLVDWQDEPEEELSSLIHHSLPFLGAPENISIQALDVSPLALMTRARQVCTCPMSIRDSIANGAKDFLEGRDVAWNKMTCSKISAVVSKLKERKRNGNRKLVFCHYRSEIDEIRRQLTAAGITLAVVDGRTPQRERETLLAHCLSEPEWDALFPKFHTTALPIYKNVMSFLGKTDVLVLQIQTACEGLNLQDFNEVYFTSPHWNPAVEDQAVARCHRQGQTKKVEVFRFIMEGHDDASYTLDEFAAKIQQRKREKAGEFFG